MLQAGGPSMLLGFSAGGTSLLADIVIFCQRHCVVVVLYYLMYPGRIDDDESKFDEES